MRQKSVNIIALVIFLLNGSLAWGLEKPKVYDVANGNSPTIAADNTGCLHVAYEHSVTYEAAKAIRDSKGHLHSVEGASVVQPGLWYTQSKDLGNTWTESKVVPGLAGGSHQPAIAVEKSGAVDLVWTGSDAADKTPDIYFTRSADGFSTWSQPIDIASTPGQSSEPAIAIAPDNSIHVVWSDTSRGENHKDVYYSYSKDGGKTWGKSPLLPADNISNTSGRSTQPVIAIGNDGTVHVAWLDTTSGETHPDIYYTYRTNDIWSEAVDLSRSSRVSSHPGIACGAKGKVYISWSDNSRKESAADIWCVVSSQLGQFGRPLNISNTSGVSGEPVITSDNDGHVIIVWSDTSSQPDKPDIYCRISTNYGGEFSNVIDLSHTTGVNKHPDVAISGNTMLAIWEETDGANKQIKASSLELKNIASGPVLNVTPNIKTRND